MDLQLWRADKYSQINRLDCPDATKEFIDAFARNFINSATDYFMTDFEIRKIVGSIKRKSQVIKSGLTPIEYIDFWITFGKVVEEWIEELEDLERYEAAGNIKKVFDAC